MRARETELTNEWMSACSFDRCYRVVSAINAISIHEKLKRSGFDGESRLDEVRKAKDVLLDFIEIFSDIVNDAERHPERIVVGVDPQDWRPGPAFPEYQEAAATDIVARHCVAGGAVRPGGT